MVASCQPYVELSAQAPWTWDGYPEGKKEKNMDSSWFALESNTYF